MCNWRKWILPGILATVILTVLAMLFHAGSIEDDLTAKAGEALDAEHPWAAVELDGRDLTLTGVAPTEEAQAAAAAIANDAYDVRVVADASTLPPIEEPFTFSATKTADGITLSGFVPPTGERTEVVAAAEAANPDVTITDNLSIARGAPEGFSALSGFGLSQLGNLTDGEVSLTNSDYSVSGTASSIDAFAEEADRLTAGLPGGGVLASNDIVPPTISPFTWSAVKSEDGSIALSGFAPSFDARAAIEAAAAEANPGASITNNIQIAAGAPDGFGDAAAYALGYLPRFSTGSVSLSDLNLTIEGLALDRDAFDAANALEGDAPEGFALTSDIVAPGPPPFEWEASFTDRVTLRGLVPSEDARETVIANTRAAFGSGIEIQDNLEIADASPDNFGAAATVGNNAISRMENATARIVDNQLSISGGAFSPSARTAIERGVAASMPSGFDTNLDLSVQPAPLEPGGIGQLDADVCVARMADILGRSQIRFATGDATIDPASFGILDRLAYTAQACPETQLEIGGHTDSDGDEVSNERLSLSRATSVANYLIVGGVSSARLSSVGYGETQPIASNDTAEGKAQNRRIEFKVIQ